MITHAEACELIEGPAAGLPELLARAGEVRDRVEQLEPNRRGTETNVTV